MASGPRGLSQEDVAAQLPGRVPRTPQGVVGSFNECTIALRKLSPALDSQSIRTTLGIVADKSWKFLEMHQGQFGRMDDTLHTRPRVSRDDTHVQWWFGAVKEVTDIDLLVRIVGHVAPMPVTGQGDLLAALAYVNHDSISPFTDHIIVAVGSACGGLPNPRRSCFALDRSGVAVHSATIPWFD